MKRNSNKNSAVGFHVTAVWETVAKADKKTVTAKKCGRMLIEKDSYAWK